jgi:hypothetical protein
VALLGKSRSDFPRRPADGRRAVLGPGVAWREAVAAEGNRRRRSGAAHWTTVANTTAHLKSQPCWRARAVCLRTPSRIVIGAKIRVGLNDIPKSGRSLAVVRVTTRSHSPEHHAQIVCGHYGDDRSRKSDGLRHRGNRFEVSQTPGRVAIAKAPVECLLLDAVANPSRLYGL